MKKNLGSTDKIIRIVLGIALLVAFFTNTVTGILGYVAIAVAAILIITSFVSFCPVYTLFGGSTCKIKE